MSPEQLAALLAVVDQGSFERAAVALQLTPSAVSQRIKALESGLGRIVVRRGNPVTATADGEVLVRLARQQQLLAAEAAAELRLDGQLTRLDVALNADSLATWFPAVFTEVAQWPATALHLHLEDEGHSSDLLRRGTVLGAVTADPVAVQGCSIEPLGVMRYLPMATAGLRDRHRTARGGVGWAAMPMVRFNDKDTIQHRLLDRVAGTDRPLPLVHQVPSSQGFLAAVRAGLGWGMIPQAQAAASPELVPLSRDHLDVPLYWQRWRLASPALQRLSLTISTAAGAALRPG